MFSWKGTVTLPIEVVSSGRFALVLEQDPEGNGDGNYVAARTSSDFMPRIEWTDVTGQPESGLVFLSNGFAVGFNAKVCSETPLYFWEILPDVIGRDWEIFSPRCSVGEDILDENGQVVVPFDPDELCQDKYYALLPMNPPPECDAATGCVKDRILCQQWNLLQQESRPLALLTTLMYGEPVESCLDSL